MASLIDAFNDAICDRLALIKFIIYAIPVFVTANCFLGKQWYLFYFCCFLTAIFLTGLMSVAINNIISNKSEILTFNIAQIAYTIFLLLLALAPTASVLFFIGYCIVTYVKLPFDIPYLPIIFKSLIWCIIASVFLTAYLSFSKKCSIKAAFNFKVIFESCIDLFINLLFLTPQILILNGILIGAVWYLFFYFKLPLTNPIFLYYCSIVIILNISIMAGYLAQAAYELIKGEDEEYRDTYYMQGTGSNLTKHRN